MRPALQQELDSDPDGSKFSLGLKAVSQLPSCPMHISTLLWGTSGLSILFKKKKGISKVGQQQNCAITGNITPSFTSV